MSTIEIVLYEPCFG